MATTVLHSSVRARAEALWASLDLGRCWCSEWEKRCRRCEHDVTLIGEALAHERALAHAGGVTVEDALALRQTRDQDEE